MGAAASAVASTVAAAPVSSLKSPLLLPPLVNHSESGSGCSVEGQ
jgi:hypothetical protein